MLHVRCCPRVRWFSDRSWIWYITDDEIHSSQRIWPGQFAPPPKKGLERVSWSRSRKYQSFVPQCQCRPQVLGVFGQLTGITNSRNKIASVLHFSWLAFASCHNFCTKRDLASGYWWYHKMDVKSNIYSSSTKIWYSFLSRNCSAYMNRNCQFLFTSKWHNSLLITWRVMEQDFWSNVYQSG